MSANTQTLSEDIRSLYARLTGDDFGDDLQLAHQMAQEEAPHDHWLQSNKLGYEARLFLSAATAFSMRCLKNDPYKCAVLTRSMAESLAQSKA